MNDQKNAPLTDKRTETMTEIFAEKPSTLSDKPTLQVVEQTDVLLPVKTANLIEFPFAQNYQTQNPVRKSFPSLRFYKDVASVIYRAWRLAKNDEFNDDALPKASTRIGRGLEKVGGTIIIEGYENINLNQETCVFVANHISTLETFFLPGIIHPTKPVTYVIKRSLSTYPFLGKILQNLNAMVVDQKNPREDLVNILRLGEEQLKLGCSVIIFPQGTRTMDVQPDKFSSLGVKLAKRAGVQMIPVALKTDAWGMGITKDVGFIRPEKIVHFKFGRPMSISGNGKEQHAESVQFIKENYDRWVLEEAQSKRIAQ